MMTFKVMTTFMPPPPASTFLAFHPQDNNIIASYSCNSQLVYASFADGNIGIFDAEYLKTQMSHCPDSLDAPTHTKQCPNHATGNYCSSSGTQPNSCWTLMGQLKFSKLRNLLEDGALLRKQGWKMDGLRVRRRLITLVQIRFKGKKRKKKR